MREGQRSSSRKVRTLTAARTIGLVFHGARGLAHSRTWPRFERAWTSRASVVECEHSCAAIKSIRVRFQTWPECCEEVVARYCEGEI